MSRDIPIIFSAPMVLALLEGRKTQTRRLAWSAKPQPHKYADHDGTSDCAHGCKAWMGPYRSGAPEGIDPFGACPKAPKRPTPWQKVKPGDRLWVRESHYVFSAGYNDGSGRDIRYRADDGECPVTWTPSIHMPRWASRLTLTVTATKIEPVQSISDDDVGKEGMIPFGGGDIGDDGKWHRLFHSAVPGNESAGDCAPNIYQELWTHLHGAGSWESNPDVVALTFNVIKENIDRVATEQPDRKARRHRPWADRTHQGR